jgi:spore coat protein A
MRLGMDPEAWMSGLSRRDFVGLGGAAVVIGVGVTVPYVLGAGGSSSTGVVLRTQRPLPHRFAVPLPIPRTLAPTRSTSTTDYFELDQTPGAAQIFPGVDTAIWGYGGTFPGPTIETTRGRMAVVSHRNLLPVPTVVHLHGGRTPPESDGYPIDFLYPDGFEDHAHDGMPTAGKAATGARDYTYPLEQRAATLWYHDHRMDFTGPSVWRGLAGFHMHRDSAENALGLPSGDRELPLMITDRSFDAEGQLLYPSRGRDLLSLPGVYGDYHAGVLGDVVLVNGAPWPEANVSAAKYRLRILNASNARRYRLSLDGLAGSDAAFTQIGSDGGLLAAPVALPAIEIAPAERFDVVVDFARVAPGTTVTMLNELGEGSTSVVMRFVVGDRVPDSSRIPETLSEVPVLRASDALITRTMKFGTGEIDGMSGWTINGNAFSTEAVEARVQLGSTEIWRLVSDFHHPVHLHLSSFQVLSRGIGGPGEFDAGWKDTIDLRPSEEASIIIPFNGYAGKYVFHCHNLEHEDMAMMANFETF